MSKNDVIPTKRSAWRDLRSNKSVRIHHYFPAYRQEMRRSLDFARDDKIVDFGSKCDRMDFFDSLTAPAEAGAVSVYKIR